MLFKALLVPVLTGEGSFLYPVATGLNKILSKPLLKAKNPLFRVSKQSYTSNFSFDDNEFTPSVPSKQPKIEKKKEKTKIIIFKTLIIKKCILY